MSIQQQDVQQAVQAVMDPATGQGLLELAQMKNLQINGGDVAFDIELSYPARSQHAALRQAAWPGVSASGADSRQTTSDTAASDENAGMSGQNTRLPAE